MALTGGTSPVEYLKAFYITLFLTTEEKDVEEALRLGKNILWGHSQWMSEAWMVGQLQRCGQTLT